MITLETNHGNIVIKLHVDKTPKTAANFEQYVDNGFYDGTIFHRVIDGFMIQGGGFDQDMQQKQTQAPIENEAKTSAQNKRGTVAMARTQDPHSATAQFFINVNDNDFLNFSGENTRGFGYCVFGEISAGMDVVDKIKGVATGSHAGHQDVPIESVVIKRAYKS